MAEVFDVGQVVALAADLQGAAASVAARASQVVTHWGQILETRVKARASGRPGPNVITGDYRRSINLELVSEGNAFGAVVGTVAVQGRRLEYGFVGVDSLGRHYDQPPFPHHLPALDETEPDFTAAVADLGVGPL